MEELINQMNPWWESEYAFPGIERKKYLDLFEQNLKNKDIILVTGLRRVGKTTLIKQFIYKLIKKGVTPRKICYLSLDAYAFNEYNIHEVTRKVRQINNLKSTEKIYFFLDEVAYKKDFKQELKNFYDIENVKIFASSSSASLLVDKKALLTGRSRLININPLDFSEFIQFKNYSYNKSEKYLLDSYFKEYMILGGIPEYVLTEDPGYIINLIDNVIYKDIIAVHGIKNISIVKDLFRLICERVGKPVSYNKLSKILGVSKDSVKEYIYYFIDAYLFHIIEMKGKLNERILGDKKIYCVDVGIKNVVTGFRDLGAVYENLVFLKIKDKNPNFIKKNGIEIDFWYDGNLIEAKYGQDFQKKQKQLFDSLKVKNKIIAQGVDFFMQ